MQSAVGLFQSLFSGQYFPGGIDKSLRRTCDFGEVLSVHAFLLADLHAREWLENSPKLKALPNSDLLFSTCDFGRIERQ